MAADFFSQYIDYVDLDNQEAPAIYHRWTLASIIGTLLGRQIYLPFGKGIIYPNQFIMLMGTPGTRKGSAMNIGRDLLKAAGYGRFSASRTSLERFLIDMKQFDVAPSEQIIDLEELVFDEPSESYVFAGEFVDFIGPKNMEFITLLTDLWDNKPDYNHPKIQGKSVYVTKPTVNLFGGSNPQTFSIAFPPEAIGTGFLSRLLLIHAEPTGKQVAWPASLDLLAQAQLAEHLKEIRSVCKGEVTFPDETRHFTEEVYKNEVYVDDSRFAFYQQRRYVHLLKLASIIAAGDIRTNVTVSDAKRANTMLSKAEQWMPRALGEFGRSRHSEVTGEILEWMNKKSMPVTISDIWKVASRSINKLPDLMEIISNLKAADKIQIKEIKGKVGYMTKHVETAKWKDKFLDLDWLTPEELL